MTQEQKTELLRDYNDRKNKLRDLEQKYGVSRAEVTRIAVELGATPRRPNMYGKAQPRKGGQTTTCLQCKKRVDVKGARFCPFCGGDIRSPKDKLRERLEKIVQHVELLPFNIRDEVRDTILDTIKELKG